MHKLCSLKDVTPGSVIEVPKDYRAQEGETAVLMGLEYKADQESIYSEFIRPDANRDFIRTSVPALPENTQVMLVDDPALRKASIEAFTSSKLKCPDLGLSVGCDPEIFVVKADDSIFPAWEFMPDEEVARVSSKEWLTKKWDYKRTCADGFVLEWQSDPDLRAHRWDETTSNTCPYKVPAYWDGAQAEFAPWGKACLETLHYGTRSGLQAVLEFARAKDPKAKLILRNVVELPEAVLKNAADRFIQFRCSQSFNIYDDPGDGIPNAREYKYRCAGGHIHIGYTRTFTAPGIEQIVRGLDGVLGVIGVSLAAGIDNPERRHTYGRAGEFRLPAHGLEYRVLSNFWLSHPAIAMLVFELGRATVRFAESGLFNLCWNARPEETREVINNCDVNGARKILTRNTAVLNGLLKGIWTKSGARSEAVLEKMQALAFKTIFGGLSVAIKDPFDIEGNWKLNNPEGWLLHCRGENDSWQSLAKKA